MSAGGGRRWLTWLHRVGYVATALVVAEIGTVTIVVGREAWHRHAWREARREQTAYRPGPLRGPDYVLPYLGTLPPAAALGPSGLRFIAYPQMNRMRYAVSLRFDGASQWAEGLLIVIRVDDRGRESISGRHRFRLPADDYRRLAEAIDSRLDGFAGDDRLGTDGTNIAIQRVRGSRITSGEGNFIEPYRSLGEAVLTAIRPTLPGVALPPANNDWYAADG